MKELRLRRPDVCVVCRTPLSAGTTARWDAARRVVTCLECWQADTSRPSEAIAPIEPEDLRSGPAGGSASYEAAARRARQAARHAQIKQARPVLGRLALRLSPEADAGRSYASGAVGEEAVGRMLSELGDRGVLALHDRRLPGSRANIDHLAVAPSGVWVVDSKRYVGKRLERAWGVLKVGGRDGSKLVVGVENQVRLVGEALQRHGLHDVPLFGALCFVEADVGLLQRPFTVGGVNVIWRRALAKRLVRPGPLDEARRQELLRVLAASFRPAA